MGDLPIRLILAAEHLARIREQVLAEVPHEACGILGGAGGQVLGVYPIPNVAANPAAAYYLDPPAQMAAMIDIEARGWELLAFYHSHPPGGRPDPSAADVQQAAYPEVLHLIAVPDGRGKIESLRAFRITGGVVTEVPVLGPDGSPLRP